MIQRCNWARGPLLEDYHDKEWGIPVHDDRTLFEFLILEGAQAGLNWLTILKKRDRYREVFKGFDPLAVSRFGEPDKQRLLEDAGIIRNRLKINAAIENAKCFLAVQKEFGSFDAYLWQFAPPTHTPVPNAASSPHSDALSADLKKRGFRFVGTTICYAFMQAVGMVNDHEPSCLRSPARS